MAYKTILTTLTSPDLSKSALEQAIAVAARWQAHLEVLCIGVDQTQPSFYYAGANAIIQQETLTRAREDSEAIEAAVQARLRPESIAWSTEPGVAQIVGLSQMVAQHARFADLVVLPPPYGEGADLADETVVEAAMFGGKAPMMMIPADFAVDQMGRKIVIAWNQSEESLTAIRLSLPLLQQADLVNICIIDPPQHGPDRSDPGGALSQMLARHGVRAEISVLAKTMPRVSDVLMRHIQDIDADMIVMGAYGHSRFREAILGGATRSMLENCPYPVLMAH
ncbi:universal stress protein [Actibacterium ureilyticum]|uniref:universal stress protein n=1 Tax=Actibacterium ureilyticum TaxID=1590614 RepID=UPI000BAB0FCE|nr:universal stress protein [Actibacterium ureilyticum]